MEFFQPFGQCGEHEGLEGRVALGQEPCPRQAFRRSSFREKAAFRIHLPEKAFPPSRRELAQGGRDQQFQKGRELECAVLLHRAKHRDPAASRGPVQQD
jgi:hypothetical protein